MDAEFSFSTSVKGTSCSRHLCTPKIVFPCLWERRGEGTVLISQQKLGLSPKIRSHILGVHAYISHVQKRTAL